MQIQKWMLIGSIVLFVGAVALAAFTFLTPFAWAQGPMGWDGRGNGPMFDQGFGPGGGMGRGMMFNNDFGPGLGMGSGGGPGMMGGMGGPENSLVAVAAEKLGLTPQELMTELQGGKTIAQVASEHNVTLDSIIEAFLAPRTERLNEMVANGRLTQEQADTMLATMRANAATHATQPWSPQGPGWDDHMGPMGGFGGGPMGGRFGGGPMGGFGGPMGKGFGGGPTGGYFGRNPIIRIAAEKLGLPQPELMTELQSGKSIAKVAEEKNIALDTIVEAVLAPRTERLNNLVADGQLTQTQVDNRLDNLRVDVIDWLNQDWNSQNATPNAESSQPETN